MSSYYNPDYYWERIVPLFKDLAASVKERAGDTDNIVKKITELETRLKALESRVNK